jgi:hypothetical protein
MLIQKQTKSLAKFARLFYFSFYSAQAKTQHTIAILLCLGVHFLELIFLYCTFADAYKERRRD